MPSKRTNDSVERILQELNREQEAKGIRDGITDSNVDDILRTIPRSTAPEDTFTATLGPISDADMPAVEVSGDLKDPESRFSTQAINDLLADLPIFQNQAAADAAHIPASGRAAASAPARQASSAPSGPDPGTGPGPGCRPDACPDSAHGAAAPSPGPSRSRNPGRSLRPSRNSSPPPRPRSPAAPARWTPPAPASSRISCARWAPTTGWTTPSCPSARTSSSAFLRRASRWCRARTASCPPTRRSPASGGCSAGAATPAR